MTVTITTNTLSSRVKYLNVSNSTVNEDAKDIVLAMADALVTLGWTRYDTAGATAVVGSNSDAGVILRRACQDVANSGHYNYLGLRLVGATNTTYTFYLIQAADWTSTTSMSAFVNAARNTVYTPNSTGRTTFLDFSLGGTVWLFDSGKTLVITSQSGTTLTKGLDSTWVVGEYKKEFGEHVDATTGYIHNGVFTNSRWLMDGNGLGADGVRYGLTGISYISPVSYQTSYQSTMGYATATSETSARYPTVNASHGGMRFSHGVGYSQFSLTECPAVSTPIDAFSRNISAPAAGGAQFTTRLLMGYYGYIGHQSYLSSCSINTFWRGASNNINVGTTTIAGVAVHNQGANNFPFSAQGTYYTALNSLQEFSPVSSTLKYTIYEPVLSCGTLNGIITSATSTFSNAAQSAYPGPQYKFSVLGKIYDFKLFGPYTSEKYTFLDSMTIPCDAEGFYQEGGVDKDFWMIPTSHFSAFVMPKT